MRVPGCDAPGGGGVYTRTGPDGQLEYFCRCTVCGRCGHHTGNSNQGHYWAYCKVQAAREREAGRGGVAAGMREFHFCCPGDCELETELEQTRERAAKLEEALACPECGARGIAPCVVKGTAQARSLHRERVFVP